jgi:two-component system sensor histidine kinase KdpD
MLAAELRSTFGLDAVAILAPDGDRSKRGGRWKELASAGSPVPASPEEAPFSAELGDGAVLVLAGSHLQAGDRRLLGAFVAQLRLAQTQGRLQAQAASAQRLAEANQLRTALLAAVSHDLRNPLATIKASATSLLSDDVQWSPAAVRNFSETINVESDRLNILVANLLDMSRLQTGAVNLKIGKVGLDDVTRSALASLSRDASKVSVDIPPTLPAVQADPALLERAVANLIDNALNWSASEQPVRVEAGMGGDRVYLRIVDRGPGIPTDQREAVFEPFRRLGGGSNATWEGVGLGLAVAKGFVEAMGGELSLDDTPGRGITAVVSLAVADREHLSDSEAMARP